MDTANFEADMTAWFFHPVVYWNQLSGLAKFNPNYSSNFNVIATGLLGDSGSNASKRMGILYGRVVYMSSRVILSTTYKNMLLHSASLGYACQDPMESGEAVSSGSLMLGVASLSYFHSVRQRVQRADT